MTSLDSVEQAVLALKRGEMIVVVDDDDRENEGDLIAAAAKITPEQMAFMVRHTSGIVCAPMTADNARRLKLDPMVAVNDAPLGTAFTVSIDYREGLTTGISARERAATACARHNSNVQANDFVRPRPCVSADRQVGRRADALGPHGSGRRPGEAGGRAAGRGHRRARQ
jgi:3,4-dihydroxy 2-butanone 4-phosphate synthase/GTP cyclohydrolase II